MKLKDSAGIYEPIYAKIIARHACLNVVDFPPILINYLLFNFITLVLSLELFFIMNKIYVLEYRPILFKMHQEVFKNNKK